MIDVGIIGLGRMGRLHMMSCLHIDDVRVAAAADASKNALETVREIDGIDLYTDYRDLLANSDDLDAVVISLPNHLHYEAARWALEADLDVFIEKPMASTPEECRRLAELVERNGKKFMVGHCMRFLEAIQRMKDRVERNCIGTLEVITLEEVMNGPFTHPVVPTPVSDWWFDRKLAGGGVLIDLGYHMIDLFRFFTGDCRVVFSCLDYRFNLPVEDGAIVLLRSSDSSTRGIVNVGWYEKTIFPKYDFRVILHGSAGFMTSDDFIPRRLHFHALKKGTKNLLRRIIGKKIDPLSYTYYYEPHYKELKHFFECVRDNSNPLITAIDGLKTSELIREAYEIHTQNLGARP